MMPGSAGSPACWRVHAVRVSRRSWRRDLRVMESQSGVDWTDLEGHTYDAVGNFPSKYFDRQWPNLQERIINHMAYSDYVPVDVSQFTPAQIAQVEHFIEPLGPQVFLVGR
jgi:hypothetical protein